MKNSFFSLLLILAPLTAIYAQGPLITHHNKKGFEIKNQTAAYFYRIITQDEQSPSLFKYLEFYCKDDIPKLTASLSKANRIHSKVGLSTSYHENGQVYQKQNYNEQHQLIDSAFTYYANGLLYCKTYYPKAADPFILKSNMADSQDNTQYVFVQDSLGQQLAKDGNGSLWIKDLLKTDSYYEQGPIQHHKRNGIWTGQYRGYSFKESWKEGEIIAGISIDSTGLEIAYDAKTYASQPEYPGGVDKLRADIANHYEYPQKALDAQVNGTLIVEFIVEKDGSMGSYKLVKDIGYGTGAVFLKLLAQLSKKWKPGIERGWPIRVSYRLPLVLSIYPQ